MPGEHLNMIETFVENNYRTNFLACSLFRRRKTKSGVKTHKEKENFKIDALHSNKNSSTGFQIYA